MISLGCDSQIKNIIGSWEKSLSLGTGGSRGIHGDIMGKIS